MNLWLRFGLLMLGMSSLCAAQTIERAEDRDDFGVLIMAHGGSAEWNHAVLEAAAPLAERYPLEVAFGMADPVSLQHGITRLERRGVKRIGVVRLFISGDSWYERTEQILGLREGAPHRPTEAYEHAPAEHAPGARHSMEFWRVRTAALFALSREGLADAPGMGRVLADRARKLSVDPKGEDVLVLAHGPEDDAENERWLASIDAHADAVRKILPFHRVRVDSLREDWPEKRAVAEKRIRDFVGAAQDEGRKVIVIPFRVQGFGPYAEVLDGMEYVADGQGLVPHEAVTEWIRDQAEALRGGTFNPPLD